MRSFLIISTILLSGCASTELISENDKTVVVKASLKSPGEAQALADQSCAKSGKSARLNQFVPANTVWANYFFDCK